MREQQPEQLSACIPSSTCYCHLHSHSHEYAMVNNFMHFVSQSSAQKRRGSKEATSWRGRGRQIWHVTEPLARAAALMRTKTGRAATISVTDAIVVALAAEHAQALLLTSDPDDLAAHATHCESEIRFAPM